MSAQLVLLKNGDATLAIVCRDLVPGASRGSRGHRMASVDGLDCPWCAGASRGRLKEIYRESDNGRTAREGGPKRWS